MSTFSFFFGRILLISYKLRLPFMYDLNIFLERVNLLLKEVGITTNKMLSDCNLNKDTIGNIKIGKKPSIDRIVTIANYLNVSVDYLIGVSDIRDPKKIAPLSKERGSEILQRALCDTGLLNQDGSISEENAEIISDFLVSNAEMLKKLMDKKKE